MERVSIVNNSIVFLKHLIMQLQYLKHFFKTVHDYIVELNDLTGIGG